MSTELDNILLKMKAQGVTISTTTANPKGVAATIQAAADRLGMGSDAGKEVSE